MRLRYHVVPVMLAVQVAAQETNFLSSLFSEATSIYGDVTSMLGNTSSDDSESTTQTTSSDSTSTTDSSETSSTSDSQSSVISASTSQTSSLAASTSDPASSSSASSGVSVTSPTSTPSSASDASGSSTQNSDHSNQNLAIILGCVLGALLIAFLVLLFICCRRRRKRRYFSSPRSRSSSSNNEKGWIAGRRTRSRSRSPDEFHSHRYSQPWENVSTAPKAFEQNQGLIRSGGENNNPFVPVAPPPRRKPVPTYQQIDNPTNGTLHSPRKALTSHPPHAYEPLSHNDDPFNGHGAALAAGAGGLALGGMAAHAAHRDHDNHHSDVMSNDLPVRRYSEKDDNMLPEAVIVPPQPVVGETNEAPKGGFDVIGVRTQQSRDSSRARRKSWSHSKENVASNGDNWEEIPLRAASPLAPTSQAPQSTPPAAVAPTNAAGAMASAVTTTTVIRSRRNSKSPYRRGLMKQTTSHLSNDVPQSIPYETTIPAQAPRTRSTTPRGRNSATRESDGFEVPPTPAIRERRDSPLGMGAPAAAAASYHNGSASPSRSHRYSISSSASPNPPVPPIPTALPPPDTRRHSMPSPARRSLNVTPSDRESPQIPLGNELEQQHSRISGFVSPPLQPYRTSAADGLMSPVSPVTNSQPGTWTRADSARLEFPPDPFAYSRTTSRDTSGFASPAYVDVPSNRSSRPASTSREPFPQAHDAVGAGNKAIVGDNGYPHHNIPRRMSGGEYDYAETGPLGPQIVNSSTRPRSMTRSQERGDRDVSSSDDSAFRVSSSMPGAWGDSSSLPRRSGDMSRYPPQAYNNAPQPRSMRSRSSSRSSRYSNAGTASQPSLVKPISRPGYGFGSGDPFDLAAMRMDSNITSYSAIAPSEYQQQQQRPDTWPNSSPSAIQEHAGYETPEQRYERLSHEHDNAIEHHGYQVGRAY